MTEFKDINEADLDALIKRLENARDYQFYLEPEDIQLIIDMLLTFVSLQTHLTETDITIQKLKKLAGIVQSSESIKKRMQENSASRNGNKNKGKPPKNKPKPKAEKITPTVVMHSLSHYKKGQACPDCDVGTLRKVEPATFIRIKGQTPFTPEKHVLERLRCDTCGKYFTADLDETVKDDGDKLQKYGYSARALICVTKSYAGTPFYRLDNMQNYMGVPVPSSSAYDQMSYVADMALPVYSYLERLAANADFFWIDDTSNKILKIKPEKRASLKDGKVRERTGVYTSGLIAGFNQGNKIVLFDTSIRHVGEYFHGIYSKRDDNLPAPVLMSDALASNRPCDTSVIISLCNSHAKRQFQDVHAHFEDEVTDVLLDYVMIWHHDKNTDALSPIERQQYHFEHSLPLLENIKKRTTAMLQSDKVEENSGLGRAIKYFLKHFEGLTRFCHVPGAAIDNNLMEQELKLIAKTRKNSLFHQTIDGATTADIINSLLATGSWCGCNVFEYLVVLQQQHQRVKQHPELYLPWNYRDQM